MMKIKAFRQWCKSVWDTPQARMTFIVVGTVLGVGVFYWPFIQANLRGSSRLTEEELSYFSKENLYPIKKERERREREEREKSQVLGNFKEDSASS